MAFTHVQDGPAATGTGNVTVSLTAASTAGTLLLAALYNGSGNTFTAPSGWVNAAGAGGGGAGVRTAVWYYAGNPGGITSVTFSTSGGGSRAFMSEFSTAAGTAQVLDSTGTASGAGPATSFPVTAGGSSAAGDLGIAAFGDLFTTSQSGQTWTNPSGWSTISLAPTGSIPHSFYYKTGLGAGVQSVTGTYSTSVNQTGWAGVIATFTEAAGSGLAVQTTTLPAGQVGTTYNARLQASGGSPPYTWAVTVGALPGGLALQASGGRGGKFGATLTYIGESTAQAATDMAGVIGRPITCTKTFQIGLADQFSTSPSERVRWGIDNGATVYIVYKPAFNTTLTTVDTTPGSGGASHVAVHGGSPADFTSLQASLQALHDLGADLKVILWQEIEGSPLTAAQYKSMLYWYEPAVHAVYPAGLNHSSSGFQIAKGNAAYITAAIATGFIDEYGVDYYGTEFYRGSRIDSFFAQVAATGKRAGVNEFDTTNTKTDPANLPTQQQETDYLNYIIGLAAQYKPGGYMWFVNQNINLSDGTISDPNDFRVPLLQQLSDTVSQGSAGGLISGTPTTTSGSPFAFTVRVTDSVPATATAALSIAVTGAATIVITTTSLPAATAGVPYSQQIGVTGGNAPLTFAITTGSLPDGLTLDAGAGLISGTPSATAATSGFTVTVTDATSLTDSQALFITVTAPVPPPSPAPPAAGFPQVIIEAGISAAAPVPPPGTFILDSPVSGILDTDRLADSTFWTDIARYFRAGSVVRPSTRVQGPLITYQGGTATATFDNADGRFDPDNPSSPYAGNLRPMVPVQIRAVYGSVSYAMWAGFIGSWAGSDLGYDMGYDEATLTGDDGFKVLAGVTIPAIPADSAGNGAGDGEDTGARVRRILDAAGWYTDHRRITVGDSPVQDTLFGDTALNLLQLTADSEIGELYMDGAGNVVFRHRQAMLEEARSTQVQAVFGDLPGTVHGSFTELACVPHRRAFDDTTLANDIQATRINGTLQEVQGLRSQRTYLFPRSYVRSDLLLEDDLTVLAWAQWVLSISRTGDDRFEAVTIDPLADPANLFPQVLAREVGDRIQIWRRPQNSGTVITQDCFIRGIQHDVDAIAGTWLTTWTLQGAVRYTGFLILDDPSTGKLDTGKLAF